MRYLQFISICLLLAAFASCDSARFPLDSTPSVKVDPRLLGNWKIKGKHEEFTVTKQTDYTYLVLYRNRRHYDIEKYPAFLSTIDNATFLNISSSEDSTAGYVFMRIIEINPVKNEVTVAAVSDSTLKDITDPLELRDRISKHMNDHAYFRDTTHFFRLR